MSKIILIVEDETSLSKALADKLAQEGYDMYRAKNGKEGLSIAFEMHPDLILLDIVMPIMGGITMLDSLRKDEWGATAQVILLTNLSDSEKIAKAMELSTYEYLVKSDWRIEDIAAKISEKLEV